MKSEEEGPLSGLNCFNIHEEYDNSGKKLINSQVFDVSKQLQHLRKQFKKLDPTETSDTDDNVEGGNDDRDFNRQEEVFETTPSFEPEKEPKKEISDEEYNNILSRLEELERIEEEAEKKNANKSVIRSKLKDNKKKKGGGGGWSSGFLNNNKTKKKKNTGKVKGTNSSSGNGEKDQQVAEQQQMEHQTQSQQTQESCSENQQKQGASSPVSETIAKQPKDIISSSDQNSTNINISNMTTNSTSKKGKVGGWSKGFLVNNNNKNNDTKGKVTAKKQQQQQDQSKKDKDDNEDNNNKKVKFASEKDHQIREIPRIGNKSVATAKLSFKQSQQQQLSSVLPTSFTNTAIRSTDSSDAPALKTFDSTVLNDSVIERPVISSTSANSNAKNKISDNNKNSKRQSRFAQERLDVSGVTATNNNTIHNDISNDNTKKISRFAQERMSMN